jgi:hypothetical protein
MKKILVLGAAVVAVGLAAGGASTASNTMPDGGVQGYGQVVSTGATVTAMTTNTVSGDASKLASVAFTSSTDVTGKTVSMTLKNGSTVVGSPYTCTLGAFTTTMTITCATADNPLLNAYDTTGLTVT